MRHSRHCKFGLLIQCQMLWSIKINLIHDTDNLQLNVSCSTSPPPAICPFSSHSKHFCSCSRKPFILTAHIIPHNMYTCPTSSLPLAAPFVISCHSGAYMSTTGASARLTAYCCCYWSRSAPESKASPAPAQRPQGGSDDWCSRSTAPKSGPVCQSKYLLYVELSTTYNSSGWCCRKPTPI